MCGSDLFMLRIIQGRGAINRNCFEQVGDGLRRSVRVSLHFGSWVEQPLWKLLTGPRRQLHRGFTSHRKIPDNLDLETHRFLRKIDWSVDGESGPKVRSSRAAEKRRERFTQFSRPHSPIKAGSCISHDHMPALFSYRAGNTQGRPAR